MNNTVLIVDDIADNINIIVNILKANNINVGIAQNGKDALIYAKKTKPALILLDIMMPEMDGFEATRKALEKNKSIDIIAMSVNKDLTSISEMLSSGAKGYLEKDVDYEEIHIAIKSLSENKNYFSTNVFIKLSKNINYQVSKNKRREKFSNITKREHEVLDNICKGLSNIEISEKLYISERTVEKHKANLFAKTNTENALKLALFAFRNDIVSL